MKVKVVGETNSRMLVLNPSPYDFSSINTPHLVLVNKEKPRIISSISLRELYITGEEIKRMKVYREIEVPVYSSVINEPSDPCFTARSVEYFAIEVSPVANESEVLKKFAERLLEEIIATRNIYKGVENALKEMVAYIMIPRNALVTVSTPRLHQRGPVAWKEGTLAVAPIHPQLYVVETIMEIQPHCGPDGYALHAVKISIFKNREKILETSKSFSA